MPTHARKQTHILAHTTLTFPHKTNNAHARANTLKHPHTCPHTVKPRETPFPSLGVLGASEWVFFFVLLPALLLLHFCFTDTHTDTQTHSKQKPLPFSLSLFFHPSVYPNPLSFLLSFPPSLSVSSTEREIVPSGLRA